MKGYDKKKMYKLKRHYMESASSRACHPRIDAYFQENGIVKSPMSMLYRQRKMRGEP